jgi:hypothetical protein
MALLLRCRERNRKVRVCLMKVHSRMSTINSTLMLVINVSRLLVGFFTSYSESPCQHGAGYLAYRE